MKAMYAAAVLGLITMPGLGGDFAFDVSGMESWGLDGDPSNDARVLDMPDTFFNVILSVSYDFMIETSGSSEFGDLMVRFGNSTGTFDGLWPDTFAPASGNGSSGIGHFTGSFETDFHLNPDLEIHVSLFEDIDDAGLDAVLLEGSTISFGVFIPSPGTGMLLGMGGLLAVRRRR